MSATADKRVSPDQSNAAISSTRAISTCAGLPRTPPCPSVVPLREKEGEYRKARRSGERSSEPDEDVCVAYLGRRQGRRALRIGMVLYDTKSLVDASDGL